MRKVGYCSRCGRCCNINNLPEGHSIGSVREDGTCTYYHHDGKQGVCLKEVTVFGKPTICELFPMSPADIALIPECTYSFIDEGSQPPSVEQRKMNNDKK